MEMNPVSLGVSVIKIVAVLAWVYGLLRVMGHTSKWVKIIGIIVAFGIVQLAISVPVGDSPIMNDFDSGLLFQACTMTMVALGAEPDLWLQRPVQPGPVGASMVSARMQPRISPSAGRMVTRVA